jgi:hypothetical protein
MEVTQRLQPIHDEACQLLAKIEDRGEKLEKVVIAVEQCLEGPVNEAVIQEVMAQQQVEATRSKSEDFEADLPRPE